MTIFRVANLDFEATGDEEYIAHLEDVPGPAVVGYTEKGKGLTSVDMKVIDLKTQDLRRIAVGKVGAHRGILARLVKIDGGWTVVIVFHALHKRTQGTPAWEAHLRKIGTIVRILRLLGFPVVIMGDGNGTPQRAAKLMGGGLKWISADVMTIFYSKRLRIGQSSITSWGKQHKYTNHKELETHLRVHRKRDHSTGRI